MRSETRSRSKLTYQDEAVSAPLAVTTWRSRPKLAPAVIVAALVATGSTAVPAPPAHALPPIPHPRPPIHPPPVRPPTSHPLPHPAPEPGPALDDIIPEPRPSNDPNEHDATGLGVPPGVAPRSTPQPADDGDGRDGTTRGDASTGDMPRHAGDGGSTGTDAAPTGTSRYAGDGDDNDGGLDLKSLGLIGGVLMSLTSLVMWLRGRA
jgi:hypothetical protein